METIETRLQAAAKTRNGVRSAGRLRLGLASFRADQSDFETNDQVIFDFSVTISDRCWTLSVSFGSVRTEGEGRGSVASAMGLSKARARQREICMFEMARAIIIMMITNKHTCFLSPRPRRARTGDTHSS